jgi:hypothetical protein
MVPISIIMLFNLYYIQGHCWEIISVANLERQQLCGVKYFFLTMYSKLIPGCMFIWQNSIRVIIIYCKLLQTRTERNGINVYTEPGYYLIKSINE